MKFTIFEDIRNLNYFYRLFAISNEIEIAGELEITPFQKFKPEFGCVYWYFQYLLLKDGKVKMDRMEIMDEYNNFFSETEVNFDWICINDIPNYQIRCTDGKWSVELFNLEYLKIIEQYGNTYWRET